MSSPDAAPILVLRALHAKDAAGERRRPRGRLAGIDLALGSGVHAVVGSPEDGTLALHDALTGTRAPVRGSVRVAGLDPAACASIRARIGALSEDPWLPAARSVEAAVRLAVGARATGPAEPALAFLAELGLGPLFGRRPEALGYAEARAVELAVALATTDPLLVVLHEPTCAVATGALARIRSRIAELAETGTCVVVTTSSAAEAALLAERALVLPRGLLRIGPAAVKAGGTEAGELVARIAADDAPRVRELAAALSSRPEVRGVSWEDAPRTREGRALGPARLSVRGDDLEACSVVLIEAVVESGVVVDSLSSFPVGRSGS